MKKNNIIIKFFRFFKKTFRYKIINIIFLSNRIVLIKDIIMNSWKLTINKV